MPPAFTQPGGFLIRQPHPQLDAVVQIDDLEGGDFFRRLYDAFAEAEADRKMREIFWRAHHDSVVAAIKGQRQRGLFRNRTRAFAEAVIPPCQSVDGANRIAQSLLRSFHDRGNTPRVARLLVIGFLPFRRTVGGRYLHRRDLVFGAVGSPVGEFGGDDVGLRVRVVERGVDHARRDAIGDQRTQGGFAGAAGETHPIAIAHAALLGVVRVHFQPVFFVPNDVVGTPGLRADIILAEDAACGEQQREAWPGALVGWDIFGDDEFAFAADEAVDVHHRRALGGLLIAGPLYRAEVVKLGVGDAGERRCTG